MEILNTNYLEKESEIIKNIEKAEFVSFDLEMTGIDHFKNNKVLDYPFERYLKYKKTSERYKIIQFGLVPWIYNKINKEYRPFPYTIYLFPQEFVIADDQFELDIKSMIFNCQTNGLDLNKWIEGGVTYLNSEQYNLIKRRIEEEDINLYNPLVLIIKFQMIK